VTWLLFLGASAIIVVAGTRLARYGDVIGEKTGLGRSWIGLVLLAATTTLPELFTGVGATAVSELPDIAVGSVFGSCMFNLFILSLMDAVQPEPLSARAHQGHALSLGLGLVPVGVAGIGMAGGAVVPAIGWVGVYTPVLIGVYFVSMRLIFTHEQRRQERERREVAEELQYASTPLGTAALRYGMAAAFVIAAALWLPDLAADIAEDTGLGDAFVGSLFVAITTSLPEIVVALSAVRIGALELGIGNILGANLFNLLILGFDDVLYRPGPILAAADPALGVSIFAVVSMNALFLIGMTYQALTKRFVVAWDTAAMAAVYVATVWLSYSLRG
jgi:cation:H+ antiporter